MLLGVESHLEGSPVKVRRSRPQPASTLLHKIHDNPHRRRQKNKHRLLAHYAISPSHLRSSVGWRRHVQVRGDSNRILIAYRPTQNHLPAVCADHALPPTFSSPGLCGFDCILHNLPRSKHDTRVFVITGYVRLVATCLYQVPTS